MVKRLACLKFEETAPILGISKSTSLLEKIYEQVVYQTGGLLRENRLE